MIVIDESLEGNIVNIIVEIKSRLGENKIKAETINEILLLSGIIKFIPK